MRGRRSRTGRSVLKAYVRTWPASLTKQGEAHRRARREKHYFLREVVKVTQISISQMEKLQLQHQLSIEQLRAKKLAGYTEAVHDPALKGLLNQMHQVSQQHIGTLNSLLGQAGLPQTPTTYF